MDKAIDWLHAPDKAGKRDDVFECDFFSVSRIGSEWMIWRFSGGDDDEKELIVLTDEAMDELRDYFAECYAEDRGGKVS